MGTFRRDRRPLSDDRIPSVREVRPAGRDPTASSAARGAMTAGSLSDLQRTVGNKGTTALVRAGSTPAGQRAAVQRDAKPGTTEFKMPGPSKVLKDHPDFQRHGTKVLAAGTMKWSLVITTSGMFPSKYTGDPSATIQVVFTPRSTGHTISFLQTVAQSRLDTGKTGKTRLDVLPDDFDPFYGAQWDPTR